jgi:hypothetical protein
MYAILHLPYVEKFTKGVYLDMLETVEGIHKFLIGIGYQNMWIAIADGDTKMAKFADKIGFKYLGTNSGLRVYAYEGVS